MSLVTQRGRTVLLMSIGTFLFGQALALRELQMAGIALAVVLVIGLATVIARRMALSVERDVFPSRTRAPGEIEVKLRVQNRGPIGGGPVLFHDTLPDRLQAAARLALPQLPARSERKVAYVLRPKLRGVYTLGPLEVALTDPFGLFLRSQAIPGTSKVVVYPAFDWLQTMPRDIRRSGTVRRSPLIGQGDEFYTLRDYREGDDLRKVHWPTALKLGELFVRQEELLREPGVFVILDTCAVKHRGQGAGASIEAAISACASVSMLTLDHGMTLDVLTSDGFLLADRRPSEAHLLEALAHLEPSRSESLLAALTQARRRRASYTSLIIITPYLSEAELGMCKALSARSGGGLCVHVVASTFDEQADEVGPGADVRKLGIPPVALQAGDSFRDVWEGGIRGVAVAR